MSYDFQIFCSISITPHNKKFSNYYQVKPIPSKNSKHYKNDGGQFRDSSLKEKETYEIRQFVVQ